MVQRRQGGISTDPVGGVSDRPPLGRNTSLQAFKSSAA
jgi:hypothetical protein